MHDQEFIAHYLLIISEFIPLECNQCTRRIAWFKLSAKTSDYVSLEEFLSCFFITGSLQPNLTSVETWGETQIKVTWQPVDFADGDGPHFYELYIDEHLEYFGNDVIYIARRLTPDTMYHFKLRSCAQNNHVCSFFSKTLSGTTAPSRK